jgi:hypothetical protein
MNVLEQINDLIKKSNKVKSGNKSWVEFSVLTKVQVNDYKIKTGKDLSGYKRIIDVSAIKHIKKHTNISDADVLLIPFIVKNYDTLELSKDSLLFTKEIGDKYYVVEEIRKGRKKLAVKTMYKTKKTLNKN